jgi:hypothetical protein
MKKIALSTFLAAATIFGANAQTSQGTLFFGGGLGFSSSSQKATAKSGGTTVETDGEKSTEFSIVPGVGYWFGFVGFYKFCKDSKSRSGQCG